MNSLFNLFGNNPKNFLNLIPQLNAFKDNFQGDPKQKVMQLLQEGKMTKEQFEYFSQMANQFRSFIK